MPECPGHRRVHRPGREVEEEVEVEVGHVVEVGRGQRHATIGESNAGDPRDAGHQRRCRDLAMGRAARSRPAHQRTRPARAGNRGNSDDEGERPPGNGKEQFQPTHMPRLCGPPIIEQRQARPGAIHVDGLVCRRAGPLRGECHVDSIDLRALRPEIVRDRAAQLVKGSVTVSSSGTSGCVSLVVCVYLEARLPLLRDLLLSVEAGTRLPDQTIVVVDANQHLETLLRHELAGRRIEVLCSRAGGLSAARNVGWKAATSEWVAFVDDDALVAADWLSALAGAAAGGEGDIVGGRIDPIWAGDRAPTWYTERIGWIVGCSFRGLPREPARVRSVIGCNMLIRRRLLDRLAGSARAWGERAAP